MAPVYAESTRLCERDFFAHDGGAGFDLASFESV
jgi:hypothetical protein